MRAWRARARLRIGVTAAIQAELPGTGHGNMWHHVLAELRDRADVKLVRRGRADVWLASGHQPPPSDRPLVVQVHEASWHDRRLRALLDPSFAVQLETATRAAVAAAQAVITPSAASREQVIAAYGRASSHVHAVAHGVDHAIFRPGLKGGRALVGSPYLLFVGLLHPRKNYEAVRHAAVRLAAGGRPHVLAIVGRPAPDRSAERYAAEATAELPGHPGRVVRFESVSVERLAALMAGAAVFCLPSHFEGFGLPALEAMACGTCVVASDRGALPEVVADAGLLPAPDPDEVADAVWRVLADPLLARRLRMRAVRRAAAFSWERTASGWLRVLRSVA